MVPPELALNAPTSPIVSVFEIVKVFVNLNFAFATPAALVCLDTVAVARCDSVPWRVVCPGLAVVKLSLPYAKYVKAVLDPVFPPSPAHSAFPTYVILISRQYNQKNVSMYFHN